MKRKEILEQTVKTVCTDREGQYGSPENNFRLIALLWSDYLGEKYIFTPQEVAIMMALLKIARISTGKYKDDNYIDLAGYAACAGELGASEASKTFEASDCGTDAPSDKEYINKLYTTVSKLTEELETTKERLKKTKRDLEILEDNYHHETSYLKEANNKLTLNEGSMILEIAKLRAENDHIQTKKDNDDYSCLDCKYDDVESYREPCINCKNCYVMLWEPKEEIGENKI